MGGPCCPGDGDLGDCACPRDQGVCYGVVIWLVSVVDCGWGICGEDLDVTFADGRVVGEDSCAGTARWGSCVAEA